MNIRDGCWGNMNRQVCCTSGQEGDGFRCVLPVVFIVWNLGRSGFPAALEAVALAVHLQDVDVVGESVQERASEALRSEDLGPLVEWEVGGDQDRSTLIALAEDLEEQFRTGAG